jgi:hypothetical protein
MVLVTALLAGACSPGETTVEGAIATAASAVASRDPVALFSVIDERSRFALASVYKTRRSAAAVIRESYPAEARAAALSELGDALEADSEAALFGLRCADACLDAFAGVLGAPREIVRRGSEVTVKTVRDTEAELYRGADGRYGLVWETAALARERTRAAAELDLIKRNAALYRAQRALKKASE